jgi:hypothetical protein
MEAQMKTSLRRFALDCIGNREQKLLAVESAAHQSRTTQYSEHTSCLLSAKACNSIDPCGATSRLPKWPILFTYITYTERECGASIRGQVRGRFEPPPHLIDPIIRPKYLRGIVCEPRRSRPRIRHRSRIN